MAAEGDVLDGQQQFLEDLHEGGEVLVDFALVAVLAVSECLVFLLIYHSIYYYWEGVSRCLPRAAVGSNRNRILMNIILIGVQQAQE